MIRFAWNRIVKRKIASFTIVLAFISLFLLIPFGFQNTKDINLVIENSIAEHGRGTYDLLVRPSHSRTNVEKELGMVEENYIGDGQGGISLNEWEKIKGNSHIEVAAPVASLGYFNGKRVSVELPILKEPTRFSWDFLTSDGLKEYSLNVPGKTFFFDGSVPGNIQYLTASNDNDLVSSAMTILMPTNYYLLAAIDIESEEKLTGLDYSDLYKNDYSSQLEQTRANLGNPPVVNVLQRADINIPLYMSLKVEKIDVKLEEYQKKLGIQKSDLLLNGYSNPDKMGKVITELSEKESLSTKEFKVDLSSYQRPFEGTAIKLDENFDLSKTDRFMSDQDTSVYYTASKIDYQVENNGLKVNIITKGNPPQYKKVKKKGVSAYQSQKVPFILEQVGEFSPKKDTSNLTSSPLGIYSTTESKTQKGKNINSTILPGSFIPTPASGLTTLASAEIIKGSKPIDAIRVRVAGINQYNKEAQEKIEKVATDLLQSGYEVDIVAGSSLKKMTLDVEGIGKIEEPWTTLGVAQELQVSWNYLSIMSIILLAAFGFIWFVARLIFEKSILEKENELLFIIGWQRKRIILRNCFEQYLLLFTAYIVSILFITLLKLDSSAYLIDTIILIIALTLTSIIFTSNRKKKTRVYSHRRIPSIFYYKNIILPTMITLSISIILIAIQFCNIGSSIDKMKETTLGQFTVDETFWIQIFILISTFILSVIGLSECINALLYNRKTEFNMYHIIGWTRKRILTHLLKETFVWAGLAMGIGTIISIIILLILNISLGWIIAGITGSVGILSLIILIITTTKKFSMKN